MRRFLTAVVIAIFAMSALTGAALAGDVHAPDPEPSAPTVEEQCLHFLDVIENGPWYKVFYAQVAYESLGCDEVLNPPPPPTDEEVCLDLLDQMENGTVFGAWLASIAYARMGCDEILA